MEIASPPSGNAIPHDHAASLAIISNTAVSVTTGTSPDFCQKVAHVCARACLADPFNGMLQREKYPGSTAEVDVDQLAETNLVRINRKCADGAFLVEAGNFAAVACWEPPVCTSAPSSILVPDEVAKSGRLIFAEFVRSIERQKALTIPKGGRFWKLSLMAREPGRVEKGVVRAVMEQGLKMAREERAPVWCEAGNERARDVYEYFGFRVLEEVRNGKGEYDGEGRRKEGGDGVSTWLMVREWTEELIMNGS